MSTYPQAKLPLSEPIDFLLADVAIRVQLTATHHALAVKRYETVNAWIERDESLLKDRVTVFYPQGSMAIGATVASKLEYDEFDIDLIAQINLPADTPPHRMLSVLEQAIRGEPGSRYYDMVERCSRCIQIQYSDDMHLDVTPMVRLPDLAERSGYIFHAPEREASSEDRKIIANPWGFAEWFKAHTPPDHSFSAAFQKRSDDYGRAHVLAKAADVDNVPDHCAAHEKSMAVIALQLIKRFRNVRYDQREGRCPPSVVLAKFVAENANQTNSLAEELLHQARQMKLAFAGAQQAGRLVEVRNPTCDSDVFTDRWPANLQEQGVFVADLTLLVSKIEALQSEVTLAEMQDILTELFGEKPTMEAVKAFNESNGRVMVDGSSRHVPGSGRFELPTKSAAASVVSVTAAASQATPKHTHFGGSQDP